ncbi:MAG: methyltransferase family protein [Candidatus Thorarchaeota archaeon]
MLNYDLICYMILGNMIVYFLIHIPIDIITIIRKKERIKTEAPEYPAWKKNDFAKISTLISSFLFWLFFTLWPLLHLLAIDSFILFFNFVVPYIGTTLQIIGLILVNLGTIIACFGRISRGLMAISWGVPKQLTTKLAFRVVRHPLYSSYCLFFLGFPLAMMNYLFLPLFFGILGYYLTAKYEEEILIKEFGEEYMEYQRKVGMLLPFIGRRKNNTE